MWIILLLVPDYKCRRTIVRFWIVWQKGATENRAPHDCALRNLAPHKGNSLTAMARLKRTKVLHARLTIALCAIWLRTEGAFPYGYGATEKRPTVRHAKKACKTRGVLFLSYYTACAVWCTIVDIAGSNTHSRITCMNNSSTADAESNVIYTAAAGVEDQITGSGLWYTDFLSDTGLFSGSTWQADTKFLEYWHSKSGTIRTMG